MNRQLAIILDGRLLTAPTINGAIPSGSAVTSGDFPIEEAFELANALENPLEVPIRIVEERVF